MNKELLKLTAIDNKTEFKQNAAKHINKNELKENQYRDTKL